MTRDALADRPVLLGRRRSNQLGFSSKLGRSTRSVALRREPVRPLPAEVRAEHGAGRIEHARGAGCGARPRAEMHLLGGPMDLVVGAIGLDRALLEPAALRLRRAEAADVELPEVHAGIAVDDPVAPSPRPAPPEAAMPAVKPQAT